jgi:hypothetical protein
MTLADAIKIARRYIIWRTAQGARQNTDADITEALSVLLAHAIGTRS